MKTHNWNTIGLFTVAVGVQILGLHSWAEARSIPFVAGVIIALGTVLKGMYQSGPSDPPTV